MKLKNIGVLTSGGDAPGMNAAIRAVTRYGIAQGYGVFGIEHGYQGLVDGAIHQLEVSSVANCIQRGGTILRTSRCPAFFTPEGRKAGADHLHAHHIDGLVVIGGDGSYRGGALLSEEHGIPVIGVPGTIDNDIPGTEDTIGFDTAVNTALDAIDRIRDTASSHDRTFVVEVMGRNSGMIAAHVGIGGGAETVLVPSAASEQDLKEMIRLIERGKKRGKTSSIIVVAEGVHANAGQFIADFAKQSGLNPHVTVLGHIQRGGSPTAHDRMLASQMGGLAVSSLEKGLKSDMIVVQNGTLTTAPLEVATKGTPKSVPSSILELVRILAI